MSKEVDLLDHYDEMNSVVEAMLKGQKSRDIAKSLGLRLVDVEKHINEWQGLARSNKHIQDRALEALSATDQHYDIIISELWSVVEDAGMNEDLRVKASTLKMVADIEQKRIEMLQKSGLLDNQQLTEQLLEQEKKQDILVGILRVLTNKYPESAAFVRTELSRVTGIVESTVITLESN